MVIVSELGDGDRSSRSVKVILSYIRSLRLAWATKNSASLLPIK